MRPAWAIRFSANRLLGLSRERGGRQSTIMQHDVQFPLVEDIRKTVMEGEHLLDLGSL